MHDDSMITIVMHCARRFEAVSGLTIFKTIQVWYDPDTETYKVFLDFHNNRLKYNILHMYVVSYGKWMLYEHSTEFDQRFLTITKQKYFLTAAVYGKSFGWFQQDTLRSRIPS